MPRRSVAFALAPELGEGPRTPRAGSARRQSVSPQTPNARRQSTHNTPPLSRRQSSQQPSLTPLLGSPFDHGAGTANMTPRRRNSMGGAAGGGPVSPGRRRLSSNDSNRDSVIHAVTRVEVEAVREQASKVMAERRKSRAALADFAARSFNEPREASTIANDNFLRHQEARVHTLEAELADTKRLLLEALYDKQEVEKEKAELQALVDELTGEAERQSSGSSMGVKPGAGKLAADKVATDRAKATILQLRLNRAEQKRALFLDFVKTQARSALTSCRTLRRSLDDLRTDFEQKVEELQDETARADENYNDILDEMAVGANLRSGRVPPSFTVGANRADASLPSAVVFEDGALPQDLDTGGSAPSNSTGVTPRAAAMRGPIRGDHPVMIRLKTLFDALDKLGSSMNQAWGKMHCFGHKDAAPSVAAPRRYLDVAMTIVKYTDYARNLGNAARHAGATQQSLTDMQLPVLQRHAGAAVGHLADELRVKTFMIFDSMRLQRSTVAIRERNFSTALKVFASLETVRRDALPLLERYQKVAHAHAKRVMSHCGELVKFTRFPACSFATDDPEQFHVMGECDRCGMPVTCEDCFRINCAQSIQHQAAYQRRRVAVSIFTQHRMVHFESLLKIADRALALLNRRQITPVTTTTRTRHIAGPGGETGESTIGTIPSETAAVMAGTGRPAGAAYMYFTRRREIDLERRAFAAGAAHGPPLASQWKSEPKLSDVALTRMIAKTELSLYHPPIAPEELVRAGGAAKYILAETELTRKAGPSSVDVTAAAASQSVLAITDKATAGSTVKGYGAAQPGAHRGHGRSHLDLTHDQGRTHMSLRTIPRPPAPPGSLQSLTARGAKPSDSAKEIGSAFTYTMSGQAPRSRGRGAARLENGETGGFMSGGATGAERDAQHFAVRDGIDESRTAAVKSKIAGHLPQLMDSTGRVIDSERVTVEDLALPDGLDGIQLEQLPPGTASPDAALHVAPPTKTSLEDDGTGNDGAATGGALKVTAAALRQLPDDPTDAVAKVQQQVAALGVLRRESESAPPAMVDATAAQTLPISGASDRGAPPAPIPPLSEVDSGTPVMAKSRRGKKEKEKEKQKPATTPRKTPRRPAPPGGKRSSGSDGSVRNKRGDSDSAMMAEDP